MKKDEKKIYVFQPNSPKAIDEDLYFRKVIKKLSRLLESSPDDEIVFQDFLEKNPCMVPGSRDEFSSAGAGSGHVPAPYKLNSFL